MAIGFSTIGAAVGMMTARSASGSFIVGGIDILLGAASDSVLSFSYVDNTNDQAHGIAIQIADPSRTWMQQYLPKKGVETTASIKVTNWLHPGDSRTIDCGIFWIDQIDCSGPPNVVNVMGTSIPVKTGIKNTKQFDSWEDVDLLTIAEEIAEENGMVVVWEAKKIPEKQERVDQSETPDLEFLRSKCKEQSLSLQVYKKQLVIYSEEEYEARPAVYILMYGASNIIAYSLSSKLEDTYASAENSFYDPDDGELIETEFEPEEPPEGTEAVLKENEVEMPPKSNITIVPSPGPNLRAEDQTLINFDAEVAAEDSKIKSKLREKNKHEKTATFTLFGNPDYRSGLNVDLVGFGIYDGKWFIESTVHDITESGYVTQLAMHCCLKGY